MPKSSGKRNNNVCYANYETSNSVDRFCGKLSKIFFSGDLFMSTGRLHKTLATG